MLESVIMEGNRFTYCPACGSKNIMTVKNGRKWECPDCSLELYNNVATAVGLLIADGSGGILFEKRAKIHSELCKLDFSYVAMDMKGYRTGSMNVNI